MRQITLKTGTFILIVLSIKISAQTTTKWFPAKLNIQPFTANLLEPNVGASYIFNNKKVQLNIGATSDIYQAAYNNTTFSVGADFFTYTRLRSENNFKFPVETIDYFFGINSGYKIKNIHNEYGVRFRLSHISAHLVDGSFNLKNNNWMGSNGPFIYSKEFVELFPYYKVNGFRIYAGLTYIFHVIPAQIGRGIYQLGFDYYLNQICSCGITPFLAYDFKLSQIDKYFGNNNISAGIKFGEYRSKGLSILLTYVSGKSIHGEFYNRSESYTTFGFKMDF